MGYKTVANTVAEWDDTSPFIFELREERGTADMPHLEAIRIDLSGLRQGFTDNFLLILKDVLIAWRNRVALATIEKNAQNLKSLFLNIKRLELFQERIDVIDDTFLLAVSASKDEFSKFQLRCLRSTFSYAPNSSLWAQGLRIEDFPDFPKRKGSYGQQIDRILAKALSRSVCVNILSKCEQAYESGRIDIGHFAFANLAFAVFCRPDSYRQIRLSDLVFDSKSNSFFLYITPAKTSVQRPEKICFRINEPLGILLQKQRQNVISTYGNLVTYENIGNLCMFPARRLRDDNSAWVHTHANQNFGMLKNSIAFDGAYPRQIQRILLNESETLGANVLRHTIGTQLAHVGASAKTIQAVLKHATDNVCRAYVDIAFQGLIEVLSDAIQPAYDAHLPAFNRFRSKFDTVVPEKAVRSDEVGTGKIELTGECGKDIQCDHAPISCYGCNRFTPCWDAEHSINLKIVQLEINEYNRRGKAFQHLTERALAAKYQIIMVMNAAERFRQDMPLEK